MSRCSVCGDPEHYESWHDSERVMQREQEAREDLDLRVSALEARVGVGQDAPEVKTDDRPWCWRVRFWWKPSPYSGTWEAACDAAMPAGSTAMQAIQEVAGWRKLDLSKVYSVEAERLIPNPHENGTP